MARRKRKSPKPGFSEDAAPYAAAAGDRAPAQQTVELGAGGRLVIPAPMRAALGMKIGDRLTIRLEDDELQVYTYQRGLRRVREILAKYLPPGVDAVDEFLRWKREQAALEAARYEKWSRDD